MSRLMSLLLQASVLIGLTLAIPVFAQTLEDNEIAPKDATIAMQNAAVESLNPVVEPQNPPVELEPTLSVEELKQKVVELNRDLLILEEELLFPASTQISVFVSTDTGEYFVLDSMRLEIDGDLVASHLYTERERFALKQGGIQRLHIGNIKSGEHEVLAIFTGKGPNNREYKRALEVDIIKSLDPVLLELKILDANEKLQPRFESQLWQAF